MARSALENTLAFLPAGTLRATAIALLREGVPAVRDALSWTLGCAGVAVEAPDLTAELAKVPDAELRDAIVASVRGVGPAEAEAVAKVALRAALASQDEDDVGIDEVVAAPGPEAPPEAAPAPAPAAPAASATPSAAPQEKPKRQTTRRVCGGTRRVTRRLPVPKGEAFALWPGERFEIVANEGRPERTVTIERRLAEGGGGIVYLARDEHGQPVIAKTGKVAGEPPRSLLIERDVLAPFDHPNLVRLLGSHEDQQANVILFFELLFPNPLLHLNRASVLERITLRRPAGVAYLPPPPAIALELIHDLVAGLEALHALGYVHNDVKLANFLVALEHREPEIDDRTYFGALQETRFHGVLIDGGGCRSLDVLEEMNRGKHDPDAPPIELTPIYAPPEALVGLPGDARERPHYSTKVDVYEAALVAFTTITGYAPYAHLRRPPNPKDLEGVLDLKRAERRGEVRPIDLEAISQARLQDSHFLDADRVGHAVCRAKFERELGDLLLQCTDPDPAKRPSAGRMKFELEKRFAIRLIPMASLGERPRIGERGPRLNRQRTFVEPAGNPKSRLAEAAGAPPSTSPSPQAAPAPVTEKLDLGQLWSNP